VGLNGARRRRRRRRRRGGAYPTERICMPWRKGTTTREE